MYTRLVLPPPPELIQNNKPVFGTFAGAPVSMDIRGVHMPFGVIPLPTFITNFRIKSRLSFTFALGNYIGLVEFYDAKIFGFNEIVFWDISSGKRYAYRHLMGPSRRLIPHELRATVCASRYKKRYIRVSWDRDKNRISLLFNVAGDSARPYANGAFISHFSEEGIGDATFVTPLPTMRRCAASYYMTFPLHGALSITPLDESTKVMDDMDGLGLIDMSRSYLLFRSRSEYVTGMGIVKGKKVVFRIQTTSLDAVDAEKYNANALFVDGEMTPLPPVRITHPRGLKGRWNIQDTESMVDLVFTPVSDLARTVSVLILRTRYHIMYGTLEGALLTKEGEKIIIKSMPGIAKHNLLRL